MSLLDSSLWDVIVASFSPEIWKDLWGPIGETLYMTAISSLIMLVFGLVIGVFFTVTNPDGLVPLKISYSVSGWIINCLRSLPQMIKRPRVLLSKKVLAMPMKACPKN